MTNRSDNFNRANSTTSLGSPSDGGSGWTVAGGVVDGISGNHAYRVSGGFVQNAADATLETLVSNVIVQGTTTVTDSFSGVSARADVALNNGITWSTNGSTNSTYLQKVTGNVATILVQFLSSANSGQRLKLVCDSTNQLTGFIDDVPCASASDATFSANTQCGITFAIANTALGVDDFSAIEIPAKVATTGSLGQFDPELRIAAWF